MKSSTTRGRNRLCSPECSAMSRSSSIRCLWQNISATASYTDGQGHQDSAKRLSRDSAARRQHIDPQRVDLRQCLGRPSACRLAQRSNGIGVNRGCGMGQVGLHCPSSGVGAVLVPWPHWTYSSTTSGSNHFIAVLNFEARYVDLVLDRGADEQAGAAHY
jgi:hypothetical protein